MPVITVELSAEMFDKLEKLADYEGEDLEETIRIAIRHQYAGMKMDEAESEENARTGFGDFDDDVPV